VLPASSHADAAFTLVAHVSTASTGGSGGDVVTSAPINTIGADFCVASLSEYTGRSGFATPTDSQSAGPWTGLTARIQGFFRIRLFYKAITPGASQTFGSSGAIGSYPSMAVACFRRRRHLMSSRRSEDRRENTTPIDGCSCRTSCAGSQRRGLSPPSQLGRALSGRDGKKPVTCRLSSDRSITGGLASDRVIDDVGSGRCSS